MPSRHHLVVALFVFVGGCSESSSTTTPVNITSSNPVTMSVAGRGDFKPLRITGEIAVRGAIAYTTTWGNADTSSAFYVWNVSGDTSRLLDSVIVSGARTLGDVQVSDDGSLLVVATERTPGAIVIYSLADPRRPAVVARYSTPNTNPGVHTAKLGRVNGRLYGFLCIDPGGGSSARLVIVDLGNPASPQEVYTKIVGAPFVHDTFIRDGLLFLALWNDGIAIWDVGGAGAGGSPSAPTELGRVRTTNGEVHNVWWLKDPITGINRYALVGEEGPGSIGHSSVGDIHVVDVSSPTALREVAYYTVSGAGTHNFSVDEANGILYAAYYNGGVRALDVRGDLGTCSDLQKSLPINGTTPLCDLRKMGREIGIGLLDRGNPVYIWGVQYLNGAVYASDMINGIWKLRAVTRS